jgi:hypothetical protein
MAKLLAVCVENLATSDPDERYVRCVALPGRQPGLRIGCGGEVLWRSDDAVCELWVSSDERLVLWRIADTEPVVVRRARRSLQVPPQKPVMLLDQDEVEIGGRSLRIHVHGPVSEEAPPQPLVLRPNRIGFRAAATATVLGATLVAGAAGAAQQSNEPVEVREHPPAPPLPPDEPDVSEVDSQDAGLDQANDASYEREPTVVPLYGVPPPPSSGCCAKQPGGDVAWRRRK